MIAFSPNAILNRQYLCLQILVEHFNGAHALLHLLLLQLEVRLEAGHLGGGREAGRRGRQRWRAWLD